MFLNRRERKYLEALTELFFPPKGPFPEGPVELKLTEKIDKAIQSLEKRNRWIMVLLIYLFEFSSLFSRFLTPFSFLPEPLRGKYIHLCEGNFIRRSLLKGLKAFYGMAYFSHPKIHQILHVDGEPYRKDPSLLPHPKPLSPLFYPQLQPGEISVDVVIVGSGAGGATVALELANQGLSVAIVEEGRPVKREDFLKPAPERLFEFYRENGFTATLGTPVISLPMGKVVGGTTVINSGTCFQTPDFVLDSWQKDLSLKGLTPIQMEPLFQKIEKKLHIRPVTPDIWGGNGEILRRGAENLGVRHQPLRRPMGQCRGMGQCVLGCPWDAKMDMRLTYLPEAIQKGARIYSSCRVEKILWKGSRAVGVKADILKQDGRKSGGNLTIRAKVVVASAGAIYTPLLLLKSAVKNRWIGGNLHIHPAYTTGALFEEEVYGWKGVMQSYGVDQWIHEGIMLEATFPPPSLHYTSGLLPYWGIRHKELYFQYKHLAEVGILISDSTPGRVYLGLDGHPWIFYSINKEDVQKISKAIARAAKLLFSAGAKEVYTGLPGFPVLGSPKEIPHLLSHNWKARDLTLGAFHPQGTCRMASDKKSGVTDSFGKVFDLSGLYIADASLIPTSIHVNPQLTIMALSMRVARRILEEEFR